MKLEAHVVTMQLRNLPLQRFREQAHEEPDLAWRPLPVLAAEREQGEYVDAAPSRRLHDVARGLDAGAVAGLTRQAASRRPATVPVHDDRDMARHGALGRFRGESVREYTIGNPQLMPRAGGRECDG
jgi:hypothetical protein